MIYDVIIVGGGISGLMAAIEAKTSSNKVAIITKGNIFKSNSSMACGGINAVLDEKDNQKIQSHIEDTYKSSLGLANLQNITYMCNRASKIISKLKLYGVDFDKDESGNIMQRPFGGGRHNRTCYVKDKTGSAITQVLIKQAKRLGITFLVNTFVLNLSTHKKRVSGVIALRRVDSNVLVYPAKSVVFAGGGYAGIFRGNSTNAQDYTGDLTAVCLRAGLTLKDMEFIQFHPTGIKKTNYLVTEAARAEGGYLVNENNERFVNELDTRDKIAKAIIQQQNNHKKVYIDLRHLGLNKIQQKLPSLYNAAFNQVGIDISKELLQIKPVAHYSMGGVEVINMVESKIAGLFICGEMANTQVHGANRLGGNSLLEATVFGELAGQKALSYSCENSFEIINYNNVIKDIEMIDYIFSSDSSKNFNAIRVSLGNCMYENVGIIRTEDSLIKAFDYIKYLRTQSYTLHCINKERRNNVELTSILELRNALEISEAIILSANLRKESRGSHFREDYPSLDEYYNKHILVNEIKKGFFKLEFEENSFLSSIRSLLINKN
ncbi:FAD-dependent oxidoreductase [Arcobacter sp. CECT 8985]|uniref:FAD-dependent oxidoreductase n=1 Tax=Arcobacter sp. CECT 8985 TaxID=1935424 RepID=UPI00100A54C4|nr:FAD-dependent oxidoreductase [Arcobacter sp. CECT 8985]RXJ87867.1 L-aspartate oxidase [Arcobacter sp. CECT 8985]